MCPDINKKNENTVTMVNTDLLLRVYQWDRSRLQARRRSSGVRVVEQPVDLPEGNSASSVTDLKSEQRGGGARDYNRLADGSRATSLCPSYLYGKVLFAQSDLCLYWW